LDDGKLTDSQGRTVDFKNTIIIMTSNLGAEAFLEEIGDDTVSAETKSKVMSRVKSHFAPEFINRIDELVIFNRLNEKSISGIVEVRLKEIEKRLEEQSFKLHVTPEAKHWLAKHGYDIAYGARPLNRLLHKKILNPIAKKVIDEEIKAGDTVKVSTRKHELEISVS
jgi:ATP-dependent Clp protease ATP-binding subunit ClpB